MEGIFVISVEYFQISKDSKDKGVLNTLLELITKSVEEFAPALNKSIKVIGLEEEQSTPRLILLDLIVTGPYLKEINIFKIRINTSGYEVSANEESFFVDKLEYIGDVINQITSNYDIQEITGQNETRNLTESVDEVIQKPRRWKPRPYVNETTGIKFQWAAKRLRDVDTAIEVNANPPWVGKMPVAKGYNKKIVLRQINRMMAKKKSGFRATNINIRKDHVLASDNHGNTVKFFMDTRHGRLFLEGPIDISSESPVSNSNHKFKR